MGQDRYAIPGFEMLTYLIDSYSKEFMISRIGDYSTYYYNK